MWKSLAFLLGSVVKAKMTDAPWFYNTSQPLLFSNGAGQFP